MIVNNHAHRDLKTRAVFLQEMAAVAYVLLSSELTHFSDRAQCQMQLESAIIYDLARRERECWYAQMQYPNWADFYLPTIVESAAERS